MAEHRMKCQTYMKNGQKHLKLTSYSLLFNPEKVAMEYTGLFPDNKQLSDQITRTLSGNTDLLFEEFKGPFSEIFSSIYLNMMNNVYSKIPLNQIYFE